MSDDRKVLMPEVLPRPMSHQQSNTRARVIAHLRILTATSAATLTLAACPFLAVDPLPPPPLCRTSRGVAGDLKATVTADQNFQGYPDAGQTVTDGGWPMGVLVEFRDDNFNGITLPLLIQATNVKWTNYDATNMLIRVIPDDPMKDIELRFSATCEGSSAVVLRALLVPNGAGGYSIQLSDVP